MNTRQTNIQTLTERARQDFERPESHPFRVGETYANRLGKYEVIELAPPRMSIRYEDGGVITADIMILARIWENLQLPPAPPEPGPRGRTTGKPATEQPAPRATRRFQGLVAKDFESNASRGTWRSQVGSLIAARLGEITGITYKAFPVGTRPELYIGREHHFNGKSAEHRAKFFFRLTEQAAEYGFYVERDAQKMDQTWDWRRFIAALREPGPLVAQVEAAMREQGLTAEAHTSKVNPNSPQETGHLGCWTATAEGLEWLPAGASTPTPCTWQDMVESLAGVAPGLGCDFYMLARTDKAEAVASGGDLVGRVAQTCAALMPLYSASAS